ncbi:lipid II flippase MurJ [Sanguibacter inulinus]|uniref:Glycosyltransferase n=1 Tax=Sanguibacter inulinus TaxID=60922 RepID=A0A853EUU7_9MICO|nr:lipid II flippase MurJ [Sanguibacter inulinus]MBF0722307.1 glycosyltransferase [Sanguibacter inulinus]NYS93452.1 glycosyltransferase [Sanguibacter inulinus]
MRSRLAAASQTLAGAAVMITAITILSRMLGFGRWIVQASELGTGGVASSYATANVLPNVLFEVAAGGALAGAVVPLLAGPLLRKARVEVDTIASALLTWAVVALVPLGVLLAVFARPVIGLLPDVGTGDQADVATYFLRVFAVQVPLYGIGVVLAGVLQANRRFFWPAAAPMFSSIVVIVAYLVFGRLADGQQGDPGALSAAALGWLAWGTTLGVAAMSLPLLVPTLRSGVRLRPTLRFPAGAGSRARRLATAGIGALVAQQVSVLVVMYAALSSGGQHAFNVYQYSQAVYVLPYAVLAVPLATSAFPRLAARADAGDRAGFARLSAVATRGVVAVSAVGAAVLVSVSAAVEAFFEAFTPGGADGMAVAIAWSAPGLVGFALLFHLSRTLYSIDGGRSAVFGAAAGWGVVAVVAAVLPAVLTRGGQDQTLTLAALGAAGSAGMLVAGTVLLVAVRRRAGAASVSGLGRTVLAAVLAGAVAAWAGHAVAGLLLPTDASVVVALGAGVVAGVVALIITAGALVVADRSVLGLLRARRAAAGSVAPETVTSPVTPLAVAASSAGAGVLHVRGDVPEDEQADLPAQTLGGRPGDTPTSTVRVLQVLGSSAGGVARHVGQLAGALAAPTSPFPSAVVVAGPASVQDLAAADPQVRFVPVEITDRPRPLADLAAVRSLRGVAVHADVVHAHGLRAGALAVLAARSVLRRDRPTVVVTLHNLPVGGRAIRTVSAVLELVVARGADSVLGVSSDLVDRARTRGARSTARALVPSPGGADGPTGVAVDREAVRAGLGVGPDELLVLTVGRLAVQKGLPILLDAASALRASTPDLQVRWAVAGGGPLHDVLAQRITSDDLPVDLLGPRGDVAALLVAADVVLSAAVWEGQPLNLQEALRAGAAIVATDAGGTREVTGDAAVLVPVGDATAIAVAVSGLLLDPAALEERRRRSRAQALTLPSIDDAVTHLATFYPRP